MNLKFKSRITLFNTIAVAFTTALVFIVIFFVVHITAYAHLDNDILIEKEDIFSNLNWKNDSIIINKMPEWDEAEHSQAEVNPTFIQIVNTKGVAVFHSSNLIEDQILYNPNIKTESYYDSQINKQVVRLGQFPIKNEKGRIIGQLTIAIPQEESVNILNNLILVLIIAFPLVLIIQYIASWLAATKSIEPVNKLIKTASGISDSNLSTRLVLPKSKDELYLLTKTINELLGRIESTITQQKQFTSNASHEIRTPLAAIRGTLEVLIRKQREPRIYETKVGEIIQQVDRIDYLLEQLLQLARIESGAAVAKCEVVNLAQLSESLLAKWEESASSRKIAIKIDIPTTFERVCDKLFMEIILNNLMSNAIKYSKQKGEIKLIANNDSIIIKDNGIGIPSNQIEHIFEPFYRTDESRSSAIKGNGLGLSIVKKLCKLQNIRISVESTEGQFTQFTLQIPLQNS